MELYYFGKIIDSVDLVLNCH